MVHKLIHILVCGSRINVFSMELYLDTQHEIHLSSNKRCGFNADPHHVYRGLHNNAVIWLIKGYFAILQGDFLQCFCAMLLYFNMAFSISFVLFLWLHVVFLTFLQFCSLCTWCYVAMLAFYFIHGFIYNICNTAHLFAQ